MIFLRGFRIGHILLNIPSRAWQLKVNNMTWMNGWNIGDRRDGRWWGELLPRGSEHEMTK
jgi:hypothetical protein